MDECKVKIAVCPKAKAAVEQIFGVDIVTEVYLVSDDALYGWGSGCWSAATHGINELTEFHLSALVTEDDVAVTGDVLPLKHSTEDQIQLEEQKLLIVFKNGRRVLIEGRYLPWSTIISAVPDSLQIVTP